MRKIGFLVLCACLALTACNSTKTAEQQVSENGTKWSWDKGTIVVETPERPAGQQSVIGLALPKMEVVRVGFVGLGMRGPGAVERFTHIPGTQVVALCDYEKERAEALEKARETGLSAAKAAGGAIASGASAAGSAVADVAAGAGAAAAETAQSVGKAAGEAFGTFFGSLKKGKRDAPSNRQSSN